MVQALLVERSIYLPCRAAYLICTRSAHPVILPATIDSVLPGYLRAARLSLPGLPGFLRSLLPDRTISPCRTGPYPPAGPDIYLVGERSSGPIYLRACYCVATVVR